MKLKKQIKDVEYFQKVGEVKLLVEVLLKIDLDKVSLDILDYSEKYKNGLTLLEYCYYHHHIRILDFAYNT